MQICPHVVGHGFFQVRGGILPSSQGCAEFPMPVLGCAHDERRMACRGRAGAIGHEYKAKNLFFYALSVSLLRLGRNLSGRIRRPFAPCCQDVAWACLSLGGGPVTAVGMASRPTGHGGTKKPFRTPVTACGTAMEGTAYFKWFSKNWVSLVSRCRRVLPP